MGQVASMIRPSIRIVTNGLGFAIRITPLSCVTRHAEVLDTRPNPRTPARTSAWRRSTAAYRTSEKV
jgi:hypothetical protein